MYNVVYMFICSTNKEILLSINNLIKNKHSTL